jgi:histidinol-phosphatase
VLDLDAELRLAHELADAADRVSLAYFRSSRLLVETKPDLSPVTQADREIELALRQRIAQAHPDHAIVGEEFGADANGASVRWILDPIDGTKRFMRGLPTYGTLIALAHGGEPLLGVVSAPALGRRWWAVRGGGAFANGERIHVSRVQRLADAHLSHASLDGWLECGRLHVPATLSQRAWSTVGFGDFWSHMLVAEGGLDAAVEPTAALWDLAPLKVIVEEAGGRFTDFAGLATAAGPTAVSSNGSGVHDELLSLLRPST